MGKAGESGKDNSGYNNHNSNCGDNKSNNDRNRNDCGYNDNANNNNSHINHANSNNNDSSHNGSNNGNRNNGSNNGNGNGNNDSNNDDSNNRKKFKISKVIKSCFSFICKNPVLLLALLTLLFFIISISYYYSAPKLGEAAGLAIGSWHGVTEGLTEGASAGKESGLSADDTEAAIINKITASKELQVLLIDLRLTDLYQQGRDYAALLGIHGEGVFTVDLAQSHTAYSTELNQVTITLPEPEFTPYLDDSSLETIAEYTRPLFNGSLENGYRGYLNSREQIEQRIQSELSGYDALVEQAKASAIEQVTHLARSVCGNNASVVVDFAEMGEGQQ